MIIKTGLFSAICLIIIYILTPIFIPVWYPATDSVEGLKYEKENTIDVLFLGTSRTAFTASPWYLWEQFGISAYSLGIDAQPPIATYYLFLEALKTQSPKAIAIEVQALDRERNYDDNESFMRESFDTTPLNLNKIKAAFYICNQSDNQRFSSYIFPFLRYHDRWSTLEAVDFENQNKPSKTKGAVASFERVGISLFNEDYPISEGKEYTLSPESEKWFFKIIEKCVSEQIDVILYASPTYTWTQEQSKYYQSLEKKYNNVHFIEFNTYNALNTISFDITQDFADTGGHVNYYGAKKMMDVVGKYLSQKLQIPNHYGDEKYDSWEKCAEYISKLEEDNTLIHAETLNECFPVLFDPRYTVIIASCDDMTVAIDEQISNNLHQLGLTADFSQGFRKSYIGVIDGGKVLYETMKNGTLNYTTEINGQMCSITSIGYNKKIPTEASVTIGNEKYTASGWGLMLVVYNKEENRIITNKIFGDSSSQIKYSNVK